MGKTRYLKVDGCQSNLHVILKLLFFISFTTSFVGGILWWTDRVINLFQFMQHDNFWNLNRMIFTHWKHLKSWVNAFWYCFVVFKQYTFHYLMKSATIRGNQSSLELLQLFDIWRYQSLVILFFSSVVILI